MRLQDYGHSLRHYVAPGYKPATDTYTYASGGAQGDTYGNSQQEQANIYNPNQQTLQESIPLLFSQLLGPGGGVPSNWTSPQAPVTAYTQNFQNSVAPVIAAQYGGGSPQISSQYAQGLTQLEGGLYEQGVGNYMNALNSGSATGFTPIGQAGNANTAANTSEAFQQGGTQSNAVSPTILSALLGGLGAQVFHP